jgi:uncharacterized protein
MADFPTRMRHRLLLATGVLHLVWLPVATQLVSVVSRVVGLALPAGLAFALGLLLATLLVWFANARILDVMFDAHHPWARVWLLSVPYFVHWCATVFLSLSGIAVGLAWLVAAAFGVTWNFGATLLALYAAGLLISSYGILIRRRVVEVEEVLVTLPGLPKEFDNLCIVHMSDLHLGALTPKHFCDAWVKKANALKPDLVALTGDYVTNGVEFHKDVAASLGQLSAPLGVFATMGNHDYFGEGRTLLAAFAQTSIQVLRNRGVCLTRGAARVYLCGVDDTWTGRADLDQALAQRAAEMPLATVLLAHDPDLFEAAAEANVGLTLSGHTHTGQIAVPFLSRRWSLSNFAHRYHGGLYRIGAATLYVSPGLGTTGVPIRIGAAPRIAKITLRCG